MNQTCFIQARTTKIRFQNMPKDINGKAISFSKPVALLIAGNNPVLLPESGYNRQITP
jgi:hypothetical protein